MKIVKSKSVVRALGCFACITGIFLNSFGQFSRLVPDTANPGQLKVETSAAVSGIRQYAEPATLVVKPHSQKPESAIDIRILFRDGVVLEDLFTVVVQACETGHCEDRITTESFLSGKAVNQAERSIDFTMNGLSPGHSYEVRASLFGLGGDPCSGNAIPAQVIRTAEGTGHPGRVLLILNNEWRAETSVTAALDQYEADIKKEYPGYETERYYVGKNPQDKWDLHLYIAEQYRDKSLSHLFFIGDNASMIERKKLLDEQGNVSSTLEMIVFTPYTSPLYFWDHFDFSTGTMELQRYQDACFRAPTEVRKPVYQHRNSALSMGMVLPARGIGNSEKIKYVTDYFDKLHRIRLGQFTFEKNLLISDGFADELPVLQAVGTNSNWNSVASLRIGRPRYPDIPDNDAVWQADFREKLNQKSYKALFLNVHGLPYYHAFGIESNDVSRLPRLDVQLINLVSCSVGDFSYPNYLAGTYLASGNVLNVRAFTTLVLVGTVGGRSYFMTYASKNGLLDQLEHGQSVGEAFRRVYHYLSAELILGDPLVKLFDKQMSGPEMPGEVIVYPNPVGEYLKLDEKLLNNAARFTLFTTAGQPVLDQDRMPERGWFVGGLSAGVYLLKITGKDGSVRVHRVVIAR